jgi:DNA repair protein RadC
LIFGLNNLYIGEKNLERIQRKFDSEKSLVDFYISTLNGLEYEVLYFAFTDLTKTWILNEILQSQHRKDTSGEISLPGVLRKGITSKASFLYIFHNHPNEDSLPSIDDKKMTFAFDMICNLIEIPLIDSIIVSSFENYSFRKNNLLLDFNYE